MLFSLLVINVLSAEDREANENELEQNQSRSLSSTQRQSGSFSVQLRDSPISIHSTNLASTPRSSRESIEHQIFTQNAPSAEDIAPPLGDDPDFDSTPRSRELMVNNHFSATDIVYGQNHLRDSAFITVWMTLGTSPLQNTGRRFMGFAGSQDITDPNIYHKIFGNPDNWLRNVQNANEMFAELRNIPHLSEFSTWEPFDISTPDRSIVSVTVTHFANANARRRRSLFNRMCPGGTVDIEAPLDSDKKAKVNRIIHQLESVDQYPFILIKCSSERNECAIVGRDRQTELVDINVRYAAFIKERVSDEQGRVELFTLDRDQRVSSCNLVSIEAHLKGHNTFRLHSKIRDSIIYERIGQRPSVATQRNLERAWVIAARMAPLCAVM